MRVRTQLALALCALAGFTAALLIAIYYFGAREILFREIRSEVLSIAATGAGRIDAGAHERLQKPGDESLPEYAAVQGALRAIRDANRRDDVHVRFVYTMRPLGDGRWVYVADAEPDGPDHSAIGDEVEFHGEPLHLDQPYAEKDFSRDEFGTWLSANAPIRDASGRPIALLGVDIAASEVVAQLSRLFWAGAAATAVALIAGIGAGWLIARWFTAPLERIGVAVRRIGEGKLDTRVDLGRDDEFGALATAVNDMGVALRERDLLKATVVRYMSRDLAEQILANRELPALRGARRKVTILIADIRNFTAMSSALAPEETVALLNEFFTRMIDAIFRHRGTLDKFLGDGCLAIFGAPLDDPEHDRMAMLAAQAMLAAAHQLSDELEKKHGVPLRIGIGLHTGDAIVGNIGSEQRMEYTAIGDTVNVTSRLEALNKEFETELLASEAVVQGAGPEFSFREVAIVTPRGAASVLKVFTLAR
jgi:adenylate cyclase